ncbi:MAG: signal peptidase II [Syntrophomonadaceae bacterium]|nr:signal peptidase II [Syntrophomonadaceae bacterium]
MRFLVVFLGVLGLDRLVKYWVQQSLPLNHSLPVIEPVLYWTHIRNKGAAFGFFQGMNDLLMVCAVLVIGGALVYILSRRPRPGIVTALALIAGGAAGNLVDRFLFGGVIDYIDIRIWPVFNLADMAIVAGSLLIVVYAVFCSPEEGRSLWKE